MRSPLTAVLLWTGLFFTLASPTQANIGYELDASKPVRSLPGGPRGLAIDQTSHDIYVAITSTNPSIGAPGEINRFNSDLTADGVFAPGGGFYTGVAVNPVTHGFYASQIKLDFSIGSFGIPRLDLFSPAGSIEGSVAMADAGSLPPLAADSSGRVFFPNSDGHTVQIFSSAGVLQQTLTCSDCPGGVFGRPISVATDAANNLYVADVSPDRVVKLAPSGGGSYSFASTIQSGRGAVAVGVDPATGDVLVGSLSGGKDYHIVAYNSSGQQFDDFGAGLFPDLPQNPPETATNLGYQLAVNGTTHKVYVGADDKFYVFEKTTITPPTATIEPANSIGQLAATMNASVNVKGHAALECEFEYTLDTDTAFASATSLPCAQMPNGPAATSISLKTPALSPETAYRYRVAVTTNAGAVTSGSQTFETLPEVPPTVTTEAATSVGLNAATIKGAVNPHGGSTTDCHFEFGTTLSYGSTTACTALPGPVTTDVAQSRKLTGLTPATTYHYRLVVTTNAGTTEGNGLTFTTASKPVDPEPEDPASTPPATPPPATNPPPANPPRTTPSPRRCKKGFHRRRVRGKVKCVKKKRRQKRASRKGR